MGLDTAEPRWFRGPNMNIGQIDASATVLAAATRVLAVTGAGVSAESGIPTFRGAGGLWEGHRATELATPGAFARDPATVWRWYQWRRGVCLEAVPNPAHRVLAEMDDVFPEFLLATQNVDGLHPQAGSSRLVELHGNIHQGRCTECEQVVPLPDQDVIDALPTCASCSALLRPHIVWFGESYRPGVLESALAFSQRAEVVIVAGTSAQVWPPIAVALRGQEAGAVLIDINPESTDLSVRADHYLAGPAGEVLPHLWDATRRRMT